MPLAAESPSRPVPARQRAATWVLGAAVVAAVALPPAWVSSGPILCPVRLVTGLPCPACGLTRSWVALGHGQVGESLQQHALGPALMLLAIVALGWSLAAPRAQPWPTGLRRATSALVVATVAFGAARMVGGL